jgi:hypothetical protein
MKRNRGFHLVFAAVLTVLSSSTAFASPPGPRGGIATEHIGGSELHLETSLPFERAVLTVRGPEGVRLQKSFGAGETISLALEVDSQPLADGAYRYRLRLSPPSGEGADKSGLFYVENGRAVSRESKRAQLANLRQDLNQERANRATGSEAARVRSATSALDQIAAPEHNLVYPSIDIYDYSTPRLTFNSSQGRLASLYASYDSGLEILSKDLYLGSDYIYMYPVDFDLSSYGDVNLYSRAGVVSLLAARNHLFLNGYGYIRLTADPDLYRYEPSAESVPLGAGPSYSAGRFRVYVTTQGMGIRTAAPSADLEIYDDDFAAMRLYSAQGGRQWAFSATPAGNIALNYIGSGGTEVSIRKRLDSDGVPTMKVQGSVSATQFLANSSRNLKTDFATLNGKEVLDKLSQVPVMSWRFKSEQESVRHYGMVAEDFRAAFALGDGATISSIDADGVAMAAIQGLNDLVQAQGEELERHRANLAKREREIAELRRAVAHLEERLLKISSDSK